MPNLVLKLAQYLTFGPESVGEIRQVGQRKKMAMLLATLEVITCGRPTPPLDPANLYTEPQTK